MFDVIFPFDLLSNIANYLVIFLFIQFFCKKKYISKKKYFPFFDKFDTFFCK